MDLALNADVDSSTESDKEPPFPQMVTPALFSDHRHGPGLGPWMLWEAYLLLLSAPFPASRPGSRKPSAVPPPPPAASGWPAMPRSYVTWESRGAESHKGASSATYFSRGRSALTCDVTFLINWVRSSEFPNN